ncbi:hypothetical protein PSACC_00131 [Paramicrosporidium saccamoebae]|uniref:Uncharacterized protein n=1 Tax=Paramicrosporidium saccamoebae TaxID=1246581 RepID=A0A2H9TQK9_9FUNG|nr:hypothetical protein PSACC_00131 [Paramicrosporidium saccamoebae]
MLGSDPILEEFVQFSVYPDPTDVENARQLYSTPPVDFMKQYLEALRLAILENCPPIVRTYIWFEEPFDLQPAGTHLYGKVFFGDGIEDEWFITFLLLEVSKTLPGVIISISDADGEFLLIEAAEYLPDWLEPDTSAHRVFVKDGNVHIIGVKDVAKPTLQKSLEFMRGCAKSAIANPSIQNAIKEKMVRFRGKSQDLHFTRCIVPRKVAAMLQMRPGKISKILKSLTVCTEMAKASLLKKVRLTDGSIDLCSIRVAFTRTQFARTLCQQVHPPRGYPMPAEESSDYLAHSLGLKLAIGAECTMLYDDDKERDNVRVEVEPELVRHFRLDSTVDSFPLLAKNENLTVEEYHGPDDSLGWLNLEEGDIMNEISQKMNGVQLNEKESEDVLQKMIEEDDNPRMNSRLLEFMRATSGHDGIDYADLSDDTSEESNATDEELIMTEILEAISTDPDLLMKIVTNCDTLGFDKAQFLTAFQQFDRKATSTVPKTGIQKGIADIDPTKVAEARTRARPIDDMDSADDVDNMDDVSNVDGTTALESSDNESQYMSSDDDAGFEMGQKPSKDEMVASSESSMDDFMETMDAELKALLADRCNEGSASDLLESAKADKSPAHGLLLSMQNKQI